jgi:hypothetical protein
MTEPKKETLQSNSIITLLQNQRSGACQDELSEKLNALNHAVRHSGKKGKLVLTITIAPLSKGGGNAVGVTDRIDLKSPQEEPEVSVFYVSEEGQLSRNDPRQREFNLRPVPADQAEQTQSAQTRAVG